MSNLHIPDTIETVPAAPRPLLEAAGRLLGVVPNLFRLVANRPAVLEGYMGLIGALAKGTLQPFTHERIALAIVQFNGYVTCPQSLPAVPCAPPAARRPCRARRTRTVRN